MIRRDAADDWLLISQVEHARLAADFARVWGNQRVPSLPLADPLIRAVRDHDNGWWSWEQSPGIDPAAGWPRNFTEMPMTVATSIWTASIDSAARGEFSHAAALRALERHLQAAGSELSSRHVDVLQCALQFRVPFTAADVERRTGRQDVVAILDAIQSAGVIGPTVAPGSAEHSGLEVTAPTLGPAPLPGIWVSRHFCYLAEQARAGRRERADELAALDAFLSEQSRRQADWMTQAVREFAGEHLDRLVNAGFRYVQFFDRLSLWLCTSERTAPAEFDLPSGGRMTWVPVSGGQVDVTPWPFSVDRLEVSVRAKRIAARIYRDDADLQEELAQSPDEELRWIVRAI